MQFDDTYFSRRDRYSLGVESTAGSYYLAIPVSNGFVDYEEYYELSPDRYATFLNSEHEAVAFAEQCRQHQHDDLLMLGPGRNRGTPI